MKPIYFIFIFVLFYSSQVHKYINRYCLNTGNLSTILSNKKLSTKVQFFFFFKLGFKKILVLPNLLETN